MTEEVKPEEVKPEGTPPPADATPETTPPTAGTEATPETTPEPPKEPREPWFQKRINELTWKARDEERKRQALEAILQAPKEAPETPAPNLDELVQQRAAAIAAQRTMAEAAERTYQLGKEKHADFDSAVQGLSQVADLSQAPHFIEAITKLQNGAEVYYHLGKNLDEAGHVLSLSPINMALELARLSASLGKPVSVSKVPPPVTPVAASAAASTGLADDLPIEEWMKRREAQLKAR